MLKVDKNLCPQNHPCPAVRVCPVGAITQKGFELPEINSEKCLLCGKCLNFCPMHAIKNN